MVWTIRVDYDGRVVIVIGINIVRRLLAVYSFVPAFVVVIVVIVVVVVLSSDVVLIGLVIFWLVIREFE